MRSPYLLNTFPLPLPPALDTLILKLVFIFGADFVGPGFQIFPLGFEFHHARIDVCDF